MKDIGNSWKMFSGTILYYHTFLYIQFLLLMTPQLNRIPGKFFFFDAYQNNDNNKCSDRSMEVKLPALYNNDKIMIIVITMRMIINCHNDNIKSM